MLHYKLLTIFFFLTISLLFAQDEEEIEIRTKGFVDTYHAFRIKTPNDWLSSRTRIRGEIALSRQNAGLFISLNSIYNSILPDKTGFELREAFMTYSNDEWEFKIGRQIIIWGIADAVRITDIVSPMDYTEFLAQDYDDIRVPVNALRTKYSNSFFNLEVVIIPVSNYFVLPIDKNNPWNIANNIADECLFNLDKKPEQNLKNLEFGGRIAFYLSGIDFSVSILRTWNKMPVFIKEVSEDDYSVLLTGIHKRMTMLGADFSFPIDKFVIRCEVAEYFNEVQSPIFNKLSLNSSTNSLIGIDWYPGDDWNLGIQYSHKYISGSLSDVDDYRNTGMGTVRISKDLFRNTLSISSFVYVDVAQGDIYNRLSADYSLNDQIHLILGYDLFSGCNGMFAIYKNNSELWIKAKYNF